MGMPQIPDGANRPNFNETIIDLLESIALEEMAIAHILNADGEKAQELIQQFACNKICFDDLQSNCRCSTELINSLIMKEWLLYNKMKAVIALKDCDKEEKDCKKCKNSQYGRNDNPCRC